MGRYGLVVVGGLTGISFTKGAVAVDHSDRGGRLLLYGSHCATLTALARLPEIAIKLISPARAKLRHVLVVAIASVQDEERPGHFGSGYRFGLVHPWYPAKAIVKFYDEGGTSQGRAAVSGSRLGVSLGRVD